MKYKIIKNKEVYNKYCSILEDLIDSNTTGIAIDDEIELLTLLIDTYDKEHSVFNDLDPVQLLLSLMVEHNVKASGLAEYLETSRGYVSDILNYKKGISKEFIRKLALRFKVSHEAFNRSYVLVTPVQKARAIKKKRTVR